MVKKAKSNSNSMILSLRKDTETAPTEGTRLQATILHNIVDRWEGTSMTYPVWGDTPSAQYITERLTDESVRDRVADFFIRREIGSVLISLIPVRTLMPKEHHLTKSQLFDGIAARPEMSADAAGVILELVLPALMSCGIVSRNFKYSVHSRYGFRRVTVEDLKLDVAMYQVVQAAQAAKLTGVDENAKQTVRVFAEVVAEAFRPVGLTLLEVNDLSRVLDDIVRGVRAHLDPLSEGGSLVGDVPSDWRNHRVVAELAQNLVFVRSALALPPGHSLSLSCESWKLEKWAPVVLAAIKSSARYGWVGKAEALRHYSLSKIRDGKGKILSCVLARSVKAQPIAQAVFAIEDSMSSGAYEINATKDRIADAVQAAYGKADFATDTGASAIISILTDLVESGWTAAKPVYVVDASGDGTNATDIAILLASTLYVRLDANGVELDEVSAALADTSPNPDEWVRVWNPRWWYVVPTRELNMDVWSGSHMGDRVVTSDPAEALLAAAEFVAVEPYPARPQVLGADAFNARVVNFDADIVQSVNQRFKFDVNVNGVTLKGALRATDCASLRSSPRTSLVQPHFNAEVVAGLASAYEMVGQILVDLEASTEDSWLTSVPDAQFFAFARRRLSREMLRLAQQLSPAFRSEIHSTVVERTIATAGLTVDEAVVMRARLNQKTFAAYVDVLALFFFLHLQNFDAERWQKLVVDEELVRTCMEFGSDR